MPIATVFAKAMPPCGQTCRRTKLAFIARFVELPRVPTSDVSKGMCEDGLLARCRARRSLFDSTNEVVSVSEFVGIAGDSYSFNRQRARRGTRKEGPGSRRNQFVAVGSGGGKDHLAISVQQKIAAFAWPHFLGFGTNSHCKPAPTIGNDFS
jgi:hypothetical protein